MAKLDPFDFDLIHEVNTKNVKKGKQIDCYLQWKKNYPAGFENKINSTSSYADSRGLHAARYEVTDQASGNNSTDVDHRMSWDKSELYNTNEMEIFAVIRAEYRFIADNNWQKRMSKKGSQGIDSLFSRKKGGTDYWAIVESKCTSNVSDYNKYCNGGSPLGRLGKANPKIKWKKKTTPLVQGGVTQMTDPWIYHAFLQESAGNPNPDVIDNLEDLWEWFHGGGGEPHKWINVYGTETFHIVPGVYGSSAAVQGLGAKQVLEDIEVEWPDDYYREKEFFALTQTTHDETGNKTLLTGQWWDISPKFQKLCDNENNKIDQKKLDKMIEDVDDYFG